ncbi:MAG: hypothetical protein SOZ27_02475 [Spirochaetia bacterium]|nr:hypothetical protein [Spirochaetia bacterium]
MFEFKRVFFLSLLFVALSCAVDFSNKTDITGTWIRYSVSARNENIREELTIELSSGKFKNAEGKVDKTIIPGKFTWNYFTDGKPDKNLSFSGSLQVSKSDFTVAFIPSDELITPVVRNFILTQFGENLSLVDVGNGDTTAVYLKKEDK